MSTPGRDVDARLLVSGDLGKKRETREASPAPSVKATRSFFLWGGKDGERERPRKERLRVLSFVFSRDLAGLSSCRRLQRTCLRSHSPSEET